MKNRPSNTIERLGVDIRGIVQGVGFRPFVFRLAQEMGLSGWVRNSSEGVRIEVEGEAERLGKFLLRLQKEKPLHADFRSLEHRPLKTKGEHRFEIRLSIAGRKTAPVLPDLATCPECLQEIFDPQNRRHRYPFTNCTQCGPRFSIVEALPYDRANTTMKKFSMCASCRSEYENPQDRRFHAQPNACPDCGPYLELWDAEGKKLVSHNAALTQSAEALRCGKILAVKGIGGFHLMVDAGNDAAVTQLRKRKLRKEKPFALMFPSLHSLQGCAEVSELEAALLTSSEAPIVLLRKKEFSRFSSGIAPGNPYLGAMLPYAPLHHLLLAELDFPVVATSGNLSEEPICIDEKEALIRLKDLADLFLTHQRPIARHVDDSIVRVVEGREMILRRARGYAPFSFPLENEAEAILAVGGHMKNTVALSVGEEVVLSQHIGDLETPQAFAGFQETMARFQDFYDAKPKRFVCDLHPDYASTRYAAEHGLPLLRVQHHHAHVVSCMAEHDLHGQVLGVAWDGTGFGSDGTIWGGEFLLSTRRAFERAAHFLTFLLPGGEKAVREPRRAALGLLYETWGEGVFAKQDLALREAFHLEEWNLLREMLLKNLHCPRVSSAGRLFDGVASLLGIRHKADFEGQAAMKLEFAAERANHRETYPFTILGDAPLIVDWRPMISAILQDRQGEKSVDHLARKFHNTLVEMILQIAERVGEKKVVLSGGCFQNKLLTELSIRRL
ncbi:MAG TPA: carbamoyltransferase HypF, partial [Deltaproteobacteria bacterium]|nr:carbamoyltransferase HypF [Deltaproteobacteria bacterium]